MKIYIASGFRRGKDALPAIPRKLAAFGVVDQTRWPSDRLT